MPSCSCCGSSKQRKPDKQNPPRKAPVAPQKNSMIYRQTATGNDNDEDAQAVKYWRSKQSPQDGLATTYEISKHPPLHPENGNILHPSVTTPEKAPRASNQQGSAFERFQPTVQRSGLVMTLSQDGEERQQGEKLQIVSTGIDQAESFDTGICADPYSTPTRSSVVSEEDKVLAQLDPFSCLPQSLLPGDEEINTLGTPQTAATTPLSPMEEEEEEDHLWDVGSEVSFETKERYLKACRVLQDGLVNKQMHKSDQEFIIELLRDAEAVDIEEGSVVGVEKLSILEEAASRLEAVPDTTAQSAPPTANTTKTNKSNVGLLACAPKGIEEVQEEPSESDFPALSTANRPLDKDLVRFDGWADNAEVDYPFQILGAEHPEELEPRVLTPRMMEAMRGFFPFRISESNFWLKFSLSRDGASLATLLESIKASTYTIIAVETTHGEVFGSFTGTAWTRHTKWFGSGEAFLWRLKKSRMTTEEQAQEADFENEMEVFPFTGYDDMVQYCTSRTIAVGGGDWLDDEFPFEDEPRGIGFMLDGDLAGGETNSSATFSNPRLCKKTSLSNEFAIRNMEVWTLTPYDNAEDAAQLEMHKLFIEHNARKGIV